MKKVEYEKTETIRPRPTGGGGGASRYKVKFNSLCLQAHSYARL